ncbi:hypothetical protein Bbelb_131500 [Branchiostoma belcheri]|nr:hypothetical protein Bbelb_131500 [Branchiostoma belcheri]
MDSDGLLIRTRTGYRRQSPWLKTVPLRSRDAVISLNRYNKTLTALDLGLSNKVVILIFMDWTLSADWWRGLDGIWLDVVTVVDYLVPNADDTSSDRLTVISQTCTALACFR